MPGPIRFFSRADAYAELSNFASYGFEQDGVYWPTVEHYFQAQKFTEEACAEHRERIRTAASPQHAKTLGRSRQHPIRPDWDSVKEDVMRHALRRKFERPELRALLLSTKNRPLVEASPHDRYWGAPGRTARGETGWALCWWSSAASFARARRARADRRNSRAGFADACVAFPC